MHRDTLKLIAGCAAIAFLLVSCSHVSVISERTVVTFISETDKTVHLYNKGPASSYDTSMYGRYLKLGSTPLRYEFTPGAYLIRQTYEVEPTEFGWQSFPVTVPGDGGVYTATLKAPETTRLGWSIAGVSIGYSLLLLAIPFAANGWNLSSAVRWGGFAGCLVVGIPVAGASTWGFKDSLGRASFKRIE